MSSVFFSQKNKNKKKQKKNKQKNKKEKKPKQKQKQKHIATTIDLLGGSMDKRRMWRHAEMRTHYADVLKSSRSR